MKNDPEKLILHKSNQESWIDAGTTLIGLAVLAYALYPAPFVEAFDRIRAVAYSWNHRVSIWEALRAIRSLPETEE